MKEKIRWMVIFVSIFMIISLFRSVVDLWQRRSIVKQEQERLRQIEQKHEALTQKFNSVQTPAFVEKEARERLGMAKVGDTIILMGDVSQKDGSQPSFPQSATPQESNWKRWWALFF